MPGCALENKGSSRFQGELGRLPLRTPDGQNIDSIIKVRHKDNRVTLGSIFQEAEEQNTSFQHNSSTVPGS